MSADVWVFNGISVVLSGLISFCIAKWVRLRTRLTIVMNPYVSFGTRALGRKLQIYDKGKPVDNMAMFLLSIKAGKVRGITWRDVCEEYKPVLLIKGLEIRGIQTLKNNRARFNIPIAVATNNSKLILNINWIRHNTCADFLVTGILKEGVAQSDVKVLLYPGLWDGVKVDAGGMIERKQDENNFEQSKDENIITTYD